MIPAPGVFAKQVESSFTAMSWMRDVRRENVREFAGRHYGTKDKKKRVANTIFESVIAIRPMLIPDEIESMITERMPDFAMDAEIFKHRIDRRIEETRLDEQTEMAVDDALMGGMGCLFVGQEASDDCAKLDNGEFWIGESYAIAIDPDDLVYDFDARTGTEMRYVGHKVRVMRDDALQKRLYGRDPEEMDPMADPRLAALCMTREEAAAAIAGTASKTSGGEETTAELSDSQMDPQSVEGIIEVWELTAWFDGTPYRVVVPAEGDKFKDSSKYLLITPYDGPEGGGHFFLVPIKVRGAIVGLAYASTIRDIHEAMVKVGNKIVQSVLSAKRQLGYQASEADAAKSLVEQANGSSVKLQDAKAVVMLDVGGLPKDAVPGFDWLGARAQATGGNTALLSGTGGIADTATESSILNSGAQQRVQDMVRNIVQFLRKVIKALAWYEWYSPLAKWTGVHPTPQGPVDYDYGPDMREGTSLDEAFEIDCDMISVQMSDPEIRKKRLLEFLGVVYQNLELVKMGVMDFKGLMAIGRQEFGLRKLDKLFPDPERLMQMAQQAQQLIAQNPQAMPMPTRPREYGGGAARQPAMSSGAGMQNPRIGATASAYAPVTRV